MVGEEYYESMVDPEYFRVETVDQPRRNITQRKADFWSQAYTPQIKREETEIEQY